MQACIVSKVKNNPREKEKTDLEDRSRSGRPAAAMNKDNTKYPDYSVVFNERKVMARSEDHGK